MRWLLLLGLSVLFSCGQESNNSTGASREDQHQYYTDVREVDLLDVALDVPVEITGNQIVFKQSFANSENGVRTTCSVAVTSGEAYTYRLDGNSLIIQTAAGEKMRLSRVSGENGIVGSWTGRVRSGDQLMSRRLTFVSEDRLVMRTHCES
jgi:hypothetical protein